METMNNIWRDFQSDIDLAASRADEMTAVAHCRERVEAEVSRLTQELDKTQFNVKSLTSEWSIMARACGSYRDFGMALTPEVLERRRLIDVADYRAATRAILERDELRAENLRLTQALQVVKRVVVSYADERADAMEVLAPNMLESGLVDACKQVKQVAISEADNSEKFDAALTRQSEGLARLIPELQKRIKPGYESYYYREALARAVDELAALVSNASKRV